MNKLMLKMSKLFLAIIFGILLIASSFSLPAFADSNQNTAEGYDACDHVYDGGSVPAGFCDHERNQADAIDTVGKVLNTVYFWVGIVAVVFIIIGGANYTLSRGDPNKVKKAKDTLLYAVIGLVIAILAFAITSFVLSAINGTAGSGGGGSGPTTTPIEIDSITVTASATELKEGKTVQLDVTFNPSNVNTNTALTYTSSNPHIASVGMTGKVTAKSAGTTTITVTTRNGKTADIDITVIAIVHADKVTVNPTELNLNVDETATVTATVEPDNTDDKTIKWTTSNSAVAIVDANGTVTAMGAGTATIVARTENDKTARVAVKVTDPNPQPSTPSSPSDNGGGPGNTPVGSANDLYVYNGTQYWLHVPTNATNNMPVIVFLHGSGEIGDEESVRYSLPQGRAMFARDDFISVVPVAEVHGWDNYLSTVKGMTDTVVQTYKANPNRIYIFGFSMGGYGTFYMVNNYTTYFRAAAPISGCPSGCSAYNLSKVPMRFSVGTAPDEKANYYDCMLNMRNDIINLGGSVEWVPMDGKSHSEVQWDTNYNYVFDWLLSH